MPLIVKQFSQNQLGITAVTQYTAPAVTTARVTSFFITNIDTVDRTITIYVVPSGGTAGAANVILNTFTIPAGSFVEIESKIAINTGGFISALASVASVINLLISGVELT